jgi:glutamate N-acetyltransferase/amino-acid N-acetyltransferase
MCPGFKAAGVAAGIKAGGLLDLGLIVSDVPATVAGVFTRNQVKAAPVLVDMERVESGEARAIIVNSGCANCYTGEEGMADALKMAALAAGALEIPEEEVLVSSTGVIGKRLDLDRIEAALPALLSALRPDGIMDVAQAFMTTDTVPKAFSLQGELDGAPFTLVGIVKGAGMIRPDMATMLCYILTDIDGSAAFLKRALKSAVSRSFNRASVDGDTSTNDTVLLLANGVSGARIRTQEQERVFQRVLDELCLSLTRAMIRDGEGVTKLVNLEVRGALTDEDAACLADTVGHSPLVKTAIFGEDANWGRIMAAIGRAGVPIEPDIIDIFFGGVPLIQAGRWCGADAEARATEVMRLPEFAITIDLHMGQGAGFLITCDFSVEYVKINADYRS